MLTLFGREIDADVLDLNGILCERQVEVRFRVTAMSSYCDGCRAGAQCYSISDPSPRPSPYPVVVT